MIRKVHSVTDSLSRAKEDRISVVTILLLIDIITSNRLQALSYTTMSGNLANRVERASYITWHDSAFCKITNPMHSRCLIHQNKTTPAPSLPDDL